MAWEKIYNYATILHDEIQKLEDAIPNEHDAEKRRRMRCRCSSLFDALRMYYETVLSTGKFVDQRRYCRELMEKLNPAFCQAYFKTTKKSKATSQP